MSSKPLQTGQEDGRPLAGPASAENPPFGLAPESHARILIVDDQATNRKLLADLLSVSGYEPAIAVSGDEALAKIRSVAPDLVLLDVLMPGLSGYEVCRMLRADPATRVLPVIMVTALDPVEERIRGLDAGADDFLTKPIDPPELLARVRSLLRIKTFHDTVQAQAAELALLNVGLEKRVQEQLGELQRLAQLKRFFPPHLAERIVTGDVDDPLATHRREVTVAILDLRGFTAFADTSEPEEVLSVLRLYHQEMGEIIEAHGGTLEEFSGSAMLVVFNDPVIVEDPAARAVRMALRMLHRFDELVYAWRKRGHDIALGIGIAHGYATIGAIGYAARIGYGVVGRVTNLAARLSTEARPGEILVSGPVQEQVEAIAETRPAEDINLEGFARNVAAWRITGLKPQTHAPDTRHAWPLKIYTLGQFALLRDGQPITFSRKVQKRPLDLLKALIASGAQNVSAQTLTESLWPDAEGDAARVSFNSNLHRLRKLIGIDDILTLSEGRLSLDMTRCWLDVQTLEALVNRIDHSAYEKRDVEHAELVYELLRLYAGHFLAHDSQESWAIAARDRFAAKFVRAVSTLGGQLEGLKQWEKAAALYTRALELDNLSETLYRLLMICYRELGETAEALKVYRRCRDMLSIVLGMKPSAETEAVRSTFSPATGPAAQPASPLRTR
ncbi:MAG: response regulator [Burkholderiales bacterium]